MVFGLRRSLYFVRLFGSTSLPSVQCPRCRRISSSIPQFDEYRSNDEKARSSPNYKYLALSFGPLLYCLNERRQLTDHLVPTVHAVTPVSPRTQHNFIADVVERSSGAVVCIELTGSQRMDFFSSPWGTSNTLLTNGSGFIVEEDGLILTNAHVVLGHPQSAIQVKLADGTVYPAYVASVDVQTDLASLRIKTKEKLPTLRLGTSKDLRPGEFVIAMGSPLTLTNTVTSGIVSATNRSSSELNIYGKDMSYIQTDAAITFGNSGGPLINLDGEVVGINAMRLAQAGGISFAIPVDYVKDFLERSKSKTSHVGMGKRYLGLTMMTLKPEVIREMQMRHHHVPPEITEGVLVWKVVVGSPAYQSGLMPGDIVTRINGIQVKSSNSIYEALEQYTVLSMTVYRNEQYYEVVVQPEDVF